MRAFALTAPRKVEYNEKEVILMRKILAALLALLMMASTATAETGVRWIDGGNADRVHLRAAPSKMAESLGLYFTGTDAILIDQQGGWAWVMIGDVEGWMDASYLTRTETARCGPWYVVDNPSSTWVNLRMSPSMGGMVIMGADNGTAVRLLGETADGWSYVECDGVMGYMRTDLLSEADDAAMGSTIIVGSTADHSYIHLYTAPNGEEIYFTATEDEVDLTFRDVNFDGIEDIVVLTALGASNFFSEFFVYDTEIGEYIRAVTDSSEDRLCNYELYPEYGLVSSYVNAGNAGLLHVRNLYRWEDNELRLIRSAVSDEWMEDSFEGSTYTQIIHGDMLHVVVKDHANWYEETVLWEILIPKEDAEYRDIFTEEMEALWQGSK